MPLSHTPYGCWRLYLTAEGRPSHVIADLRDGRQQKLDAQTYAVIDTYGQLGGGGKGHYRKQKSEKVLLTPGAPEEVAVVREIFELHFRRGFGGKRIADVLNRRGVRSPQGKAWSQHQVDVIYEQEVYTGRSVGNRTSSAIYHERFASAPKPVELDAAVRATAKNIPVRHRPRSEWFVQAQPLMADFLDAELRAMAMAEHERIWRTRGDADRPKRSKSKHQVSEYLLTGLLHAKQDGEPLVGILCGRVGKKVRYYRHRRGRRGYVKGSMFNRMVAAKPLEDAVVALVGEVLANEQDLRDRVVAFVEGEARKAAPGKQLAELQSRRERLKRRTALIVKTFDEETLADAEGELDRLKAERRTLDEQIAAAEGAATLRGLDPNAVADAVLGRIKSMGKPNELPAFALRQLIASLVGRVVVDMETKAVEVELMLPIDEKFFGGLAEGGAMRLVGTSASSTSDETHRVLMLDLVAADCRYVMTSSRACYECRRRQAA